MRLRIMRLRSSEILRRVASSTLPAATFMTASAFSRSAPPTGRSSPESRSTTLVVRTESRMSG